MGQLSTTNCEQIRGAVSESLDGELAEIDHARLEAHLAHCAACRAYSADAAGTARLLREAPLEQLDFPIALPSRRLALARRLQVTAAAAALLVTVGLSAVVGSVGSGGGGSGLSVSSASASSAQPAKLRFTEQELRMLYRASSARDGLKLHGRMTM
jgi:predicted anti-sigma-YlaC factor YlaD